MTLSDRAAVAVSIVVPVRNEAENVAPLVAEVVSALGSRWVYEIIYVNDGSTDHSLEILHRLSHEDSPYFMCAAQCPLT